MSTRALIIGGTGPTGPHLVNGLVERGHDVTMMHRGTHDSPLIPDSVERLIGDPHDATMFRYPVVYGPGQLGASVWSVMQRALDGRPHIVLPDAGMAVVTRGYARNVAHAVLLAVDRPEAAAGRIYNCGDEQQFTLAQFVGLICEAMDHTMEVVGVPAEVAYSTLDLLPLQSAPVHQMLDLHAIRTDLGYRDLVPAIEAIPEVVGWYLENRPPSTGSTAERAAAFNYAAEDEQVAIASDARRRLAAVDHVTHEVHHPYPHPRVPGLARDHQRR